MPKSLRPLASAWQSGIPKILLRGPLLRLPGVQLPDKTAISLATGRRVALLTGLVAGLLCACNLIHRPGDALTQKSTPAPGRRSAIAPERKPVPLPPPLLLSQPAATLQPLPTPEPLLRPSPASLPVAATTASTAATTAPVSAPVSAPAPASAPLPAPVSAPALELPPIPAAPGESAAPPPGFLVPSGLFGTAPPPAKPAASSNQAASDSPPATEPPAKSDEKAPVADTASGNATPPAATREGSAPAKATADASARAKAEANDKTGTPPSIDAAPPPAAASKGGGNATPGTAISEITRKLAPTKLPPVYIYASPTTRIYLAAGGVNYQSNIDIWHLFLKHQDVPFEVIDNLQVLENKPDAVLILPSSLALNEQERKSLLRFQERGGALLATWLCGARNDNGQWLGLQFMENLLHTQVAGSTEPFADDSFMLPHGNSPVSHQLPAGQRVWTERVPNWYPLRLSSPNLAAHILDWSRTVKNKKPGGLISYDQRVTSSGASARTVLLAFPERLWFSADANAMNAIASDALYWLMRQPAVYLSAWPYPYRSAFLLSINASDFTEEIDAAFAQQTEAIGWHGTYYVLSEHADSGKDLLQKLQKRGHEIGYFGDRLTSFQNQSASQQKKRIDSMVNELRENDLEVASPAGFRPPLEAMDATTIRLLRAKGISHIIADQGASDARLPVLSPGPVASNGEPLVLIPRTLSSPEDLFSNNNPADAIEHFLAEIKVSDQMGGVGVISVPTRSSLTPAQWGQILATLKEREQKVWLTQANPLASWWREHERVKVSLNADVTPALLTVEVTGEGPLQQTMPLLANLPRPGKSPRLVAEGHSAPAPQIAPFDDLRAAIILPKLAPGKYEWYIWFDK